MSIEQAINDLPDDKELSYEDTPTFSYETSYKGIGLDTSDLKRLVRKLAAAREALEIYGNEENWQDIFDDGKWEFKPLGEEAGGYKLAQSALTAIDEME